MKFISNLLFFTCICFCLSLSVSAQTEKLSRKERKKQEQLRKKVEQEVAQSDSEAKTAHSKRDLETAEALFVEGMKFFMLEDFSKANEIFQRSARLNPANAAVQFKIAQTWLSLGNTASSLPAALKALELDNKNKYYYLLLAQIYGSQKQYNEAAQVLTRLLKEVPGTEEYQLQLAELYTSQNKFQEALKTYEKLEKTVGSYDELHFRKQQLYLRLNQLDKAIEEGNLLIASAPDEPRYLLAQAQLLASNNRFTQAFEVLDRAVKLDPDNPYAHMLLADILRQQGKPAEAAVQIKAAFANPALDIDSRVRVLVDQMRNMSSPEAQTYALELADLTLKAHPAEAKAYAVAGDLQAMANKKKEARTNYLKAVKLDQSHFQIWQQILVLDAELEQNDSLLVHSEKALEYFPNQALLWYYNGTAQMLKKNYPKAVRSLEQGKKLSADNPELQLQFNAQLGDAYNSLKEYAKSDAAYDAALAYDPNNDHVLNNYSYFLSLRGQNLDKARSMSAKLVQRHPADATYLDTHAWVLYKLKEYTEAKGFLEKAIQASPSGTILEHYGDVLYQLGDNQKALTQWQLAKQKGEASELIDKKIKDKKLYE